MNVYEEKLREYLRARGIQAEQLNFNESCHSVEEAAKAVNASAVDFVKSICLVDSEGGLIVAVVKGEDKVHTGLVAAAVNVRKPRMATPEEILERTGYPCGGTPPLGFHATFLVDTKVVEREMVYAGGGSENSLLRISTKGLLEANKGRVVKVRR